VHDPERVGANHRAELRVRTPLGPHSDLRLEADLLLDEDDGEGEALVYCGECWKLEFGSAGDNT